MGLFHGFQPTRYDSGYAPAVAVADPYAVEVHQAQLQGPTDLWVNLGHVPYHVEWKGARRYDRGQRPAVAAVGTVVVKVHEAGDTDALWYHRGRVTLEQGMATSVDLGIARAYGTGFRPSVALAAFGDVQVVIETHETGSGGLAYTVGVLHPDTTDVEWGETQVYGSGYRPSVEVAAVDGLDGYAVVVEVHQAAERGTSGLWAHCGRLLPEHGAVDWGTPVRYDHGFAPAVASSGRAEVLEVHQADESSPAALWSAAAVIGPDRTLRWRPATQYDRGVGPRLGMHYDMYVEVHGSGSGALWYQGGRTPG